MREKLMVYECEVIFSVSGIVRPSVEKVTVRAKDHAEAHDTAIMTVAARNSEYIETLRVNTARIV
jgi:hypothetical protein